MRSANFTRLSLTLVAIGLVGAIGFFLMVKHAVHSKPKLTSIVVALPGEVPSQINNREVRSASQYLIMAHLTRPLVHLSREAQIEGDLAETWSIRDHFSTYVFEISERARWSNGDPITAGELARGIQEQMKIGATTHFDFRTISSVTSNGKTLAIYLKEPNPNFLSQLVHPEFGPVKAIRSGSEQHDFQVTAGAYSIKEVSANEIVMVKNPYFPFAKEKSPEIVHFLGVHQMEEQLDLLQSGKADVLIPMNGFTPQHFVDLKKRFNIQTIDTHIGYTFWLAPNFNSPVFSRISARQWLASEIDGLKIDFDAHQPYWSRARQIYLNDGFGRPTPDELEKVYDSLHRNSGTPPSVLRFLVSSRFPFSRDVERHLSTRGVRVTLDEYQDLTEFEVKLRTGAFDVMQINNDFSSYDVLENLSVTFSSSRPLIAAGKALGSYQNLLNRARAEMDPETKHVILKEIGLRLLSDCAVIPIAYRKNILLASNSWNFSGWSDLYPDVRFWKIEPKTADQDTEP